MSVVSYVLALVGLLGIIAVGGSETKALTLALWMASGTKYRGRERIKLVLMRYYWASPLGYERFAASRGRSPAYSVRSSALLFLMTWVISEAAVGRTTAYTAQTFGAAFIVSGLYFVARHGRAFSKQREHVNAQLATCNPLQFN